MRPFVPMLQDYTVWRSLKAVEYEFIHFGGSYELTRVNSYADINNNAHWIPEFSMLFFQTTLPYLFSVALNIVDDGREMKYENVIYTFDNLAEIPYIEEPTYTFAHIMIPHHPYVIDRDGNYLTLNEADNRSESINFIDQLIAANNMLMTLIE